MFTREVCTCGCNAVILTQRDLATCWLAAVDAHADVSMADTKAHDDRLMRSVAPGMAPEYQTAYEIATTAVRQGAGIHEATMAAEMAVKALLTPASPA